MSKKNKTDRRSAPAIAEVFALAKELGWTHLNDNEQRLIQALRWTTWHGRGLVMEFADHVRAKHPWIDGSPLNTAAPLTVCKRASNG